MEFSPKKLECPVCSKSVLDSAYDTHVEVCLHSRFPTKSIQSPLKTTVNGGLLQKSNMTGLRETIKSIQTVMEKCVDYIERSPTQARDKVLDEAAMSFVGKMNELTETMENSRANPLQLSSQSSEVLSMPSKLISIPLSDSSPSPSPSPAPSSPHSPSPIVLFPSSFQSLSSKGQNVSQFYFQVPKAKSPRKQTTAMRKQQNDEVPRLPLSNLTNAPYSSSCSSFPSPSSSSSSRSRSRSSMFNIYSSKKAHSTRFIVKNRSKDQSQIKSNDNQSCEMQSISFYEHAYQTPRGHSDRKSISESPIFCIGDTTHMNDEMIAHRIQEEELKRLEKRRQAKLEEENKIFEELLRVEGTCMMCNNHKGSEYMLTVSDTCNHRYCAACLEQYLLSLLDNKDGRLSDRDLFCPQGRQERTQSCSDQNECNQIIPDWLIKRVLSPVDYERISQAQLRLCLEFDENMVTCPNSTCSSTFEAVVGTAKDLLNDIIHASDGKQLSMEAKEHRAKYRYRCPDCEVVFCSSCKHSPYHIGYTCEQYARYLVTDKCRYCTDSLSNSNLATKSRLTSIVDCCNDADCLEKRDMACDRMLPCGHPCGGIYQEEECLDCLQCSNSLDGSDFCNICWTEELREGPTVQLKCGHVFHYKCVLNKLKSQWAGARITFGFLNCPLCQALIEHDSEITNVMRPLLKLKETVHSKAIQRLKYEGLSDAKELKQKGGKYYNNPGLFATDKFAYYPCFKCKKPFFGGQRACEAANDNGNDEKFRAEELICGGCVAGKNAKNCKLHGKDYIEYKCKFCCSIATWYCWGTTHFCDKCHKKQEQGDYLTRKKPSQLPKCPGQDQCPLGVEHPPNGTEFALGCGICRPRFV